MRLREASLNDLCQQVDQKAQAQIAVVTVKSLDGQDAVTYAVALYQKWGIGAKGKDRGVLILLATNGSQVLDYGGIRAGGDSSGREGGRVRTRNGAPAAQRGLCGRGHLDDQRAWPR